MTENVSIYPKFLSTKDVMKILKIGNKACLELFHRKDFPSVKVGRSFKVLEDSFIEYFKTRQVKEDKMKF